MVSFSLRAAKLLSLVCVVFFCNVTAISVPEDGTTLDTEKTAEDLDGNERISVNAAAHLTHGSGVPSKAPHASNLQPKVQVMRSEKKSAESNDVSNLREHKDISEAEVLADFQTYFDGAWINMIGLIAASSSVGQETTGTPGKAIDGNEDTDPTCRRNCTHKMGSCTHTKYDIHPWWEVELGTPYHISVVNVTNRAECCGEQCDICSPMDVSVDETICADSNVLKKGETKAIACPYVGNAVRVSLKDEDELMICEVKVKGSPQALLLAGLKQCEQHSFLAQALLRINSLGHGIHGRCLAGDSVVQTETPRGFHGVSVGQALTPGGELQTTSPECQEYLLKSDESVQGAQWQTAKPVNSDEPDSGAGDGGAVGSCMLLHGRSVVGVEDPETTLFAGGEHAQRGAKCFRKLRCPHDLAPWRKQAGIGLEKGELYAKQPKAEFDSKSMI